MTKPELGPIGELLYAEMGFWASEDEANDWTLAKICDAIAVVFFEPLYRIVGEGPNGEAGWTPRLDPDGPVDGLAFLAQFVGAILTPGMDEAQRRAEIREPTSWKRGQVSSIELVTKRELTGEKWVRIRPRTPGPGHIYIRTLLSETPNPARVEAELLEHGVPAWELLDYEAIDGVSWADVAGGWGEWAELAEDLDGWEAVSHLLPDELPE